METWRHCQIYLNLSFFSKYFVYLPKHVNPQHLHVTAIVPSLPYSFHKNGSRSCVANHLIDHCWPSSHSRWGTCSSTTVTANDQDNWTFKIVVSILLPSLHGPLSCQDLNGSSWHLTWRPWSKQLLPLSATYTVLTQALEWRHGHTDIACLPEAGVPALQPSTTRNVNIPRGSLKPPYESRSLMATSSHT